MKTTNKKKRLRENNNNNQWSILHKNNKYYKNAPNYKELGELYPWFKEYLVNNRINWKNPESIYAVTKVLLKHDFNLEINMPISLKNLCPPLPRSINYICWIADLLQMNNIIEEKKEINGLDIGTGCICIFPLLGYKMYGWHFLGTDIDQHSIQSAQENIITNKLENIISLQHVNDAKHIFHNVIHNNDDIHFNFSMCNPPFYDSNINEKPYRKNPNRNTSYTNNESTYPGGEVAFITIMMNESVQYAKNVTWFTSMVGKKKSLKPLRKVLSTLPIKMATETEFKQGKQSRWGIAWTFDESYRPEWLKKLDSQTNKTNNNKKLKI